MVICITELSSDPDGWYKHGYSETIDLSKSAVKDNVERVDARTITIEEFQERYERSYTPVVVTHLQDDWQAEQKWTLDVRKPYIIHKSF